VTLSWPHKDLSPNARVHWARKAQLVKLERADAGWRTVCALGTSVKPKWPSATVSMTFCPPDKRRRDKDNLIASMKAANDGISDALGVDDSRFVSTYQMGSPVKGGAVIVTIRGIE
jgi:crossover junction endodeoxyribonuclease RusA